MSNGRYKPYPNYHASGEDWIGDIPTGWKVRRGKFLFREVSERSERGEETLLSVSEYYGVKPRGEVVEEGEFLSRAESLEGYKKCQVDDLVMNIMLAWKRGLGVSKFDGIVSPAYSVFRFFEGIDPNYMHHLLRTDLYTGHFKTRSTGVIDSRLRLYPESFFDTAIVVPPRSEQTQIAKFLDRETAKIDRLIEKQEALIRLLKEKRQAVISHAVTKGLNPHAPLKDSGIPWLGQVPAHWKTSKLGYNARIANGATPSRETPGYWENGTIGWLNSGKINDVVITEADQFITKRAVIETSVQAVAENDLLIAITGEGQTRGRVAICKTNATINQHLASIRIHDRNLHHVFLFYWLIAQYDRIRFESAEGGSTKAAITCASIAAYPLPIPPMSEQIGIVDHLKQNQKRLDDVEALASEQITLLQERRTALISAAVTGKIDVRHWQPPEN